AVIDRWSADAMLAALQILAEARSRMRGIAHGRLLVEIALVRVARLENLTELSELVERISAIQAGSSPVRKAVAQGLKKKHSITESSIIPAARPPVTVEAPPSRLENFSDPREPENLTSLPSMPASATIEEACTKSVENDETTAEAVSPAEDPGSAEA